MEATTPRPITPDERSSLKQIILRAGIGPIKTLNAHERQLVLSILKGAEPVVIPNKLEKLQAKLNGTYSAWGGTIKALYRSVLGGPVLQEIQAELAKIVVKAPFVAVNAEGDAHTEEGSTPSSPTLPASSDTDAPAPKKKLSSARIDESQLPPNWRMDLDSLDLDAAQEKYLPCKARVDDTKKEVLALFKIKPPELKKADWLDTILTELDTLEHFPGEIGPAVKAKKEELITFLKEQLGVESNLRTDLTEAYNTLWRKT